MSTAAGRNDALRWLEEETAAGEGREGRGQRGRSGLEPIQDLPVRRMDGYFFVLQGKKSQKYLLYYKIF